MKLPQTTFVLLLLYTLSLRSSPNSYPTTTRIEILACYASFQFYSQLLITWPWSLHHLIEFTKIYVVVLVLGHFTIIGADQLIVDRPKFMQYLRHHTRLTPMSLSSKKIHQDSKSKTDLLAERPWRSNKSMSATYVLFGLFLILNGIS